MSEKPLIYMLKITVRIIVRVILNGTCSKSLTELYCRQQNKAPTGKEKSFTSKLLADGNGLVLLHGSWWPDDQNESKITYLQIQEYEICHGKPHKLTMIVNSKDGLKSEFVLMKTQGVNYASHVVEILDLYTKVNRAKAAYNTKYAYHFQPNMQEKKENVNADKKIIIPKKTATTVFNKIPTIKKAFSSEYIISNDKQDYVSKPSKSVKNSENIREKTHIKEKLVKQEKATKQMNGENSQQVGDYTSSHCKTTYITVKSRKFTPRNTISSVTYYGEDKRKSVDKPRGDYKISNTRERVVNDEFIGTPYTSTECDKNNSPWEVNICYISQDSFGSFEDSEGPIYMYSAHQMMPRCSEPKYELKSIHDLGISEDNDLASSSDSLDNWNELDDFILRCRQSKITK